MSEGLTRRGFLGHSAALATAVGVTGLSQTARAEDPPKGKLKKAVLWAMLPGSMSVADRFKLAVDCGFDGIEGQTTPDKKAVDEMRAAADKAGTRIHSVMNMGHWENPLTSSDPEVVKKSVTAIKVSIDNAKTWGADTILVVPGVVNAQTRYQDAYARSQKVLREQVLPLAREADIVIAIENVWNKFLLSPLEFAKFVDEINDKHLMAYFDIGNNVQYAFPEDWTLTLGPRIRRFHLKDFKRGTNEWKPLREGDIDWPAVRRAIGEIGYSGFLTAELNGGDEAYLREVAKRIDLIFEGK